MWLAMNALKQAAKTVLPAPVVRRILRRRTERARERAIRSIDLSRIQLIEQATVAQLREPSFLENELLPRLGLNDELLHEFPPSLRSHAGGGLLHWQYPNQFSKYLVELSRHQIGSYLEIGVRHGGTFVITLEYLRRFHPILRAVGVDLAIADTLRTYSSSRPGTAVFRADSHSANFEAFIQAQEPFDLVLIDGDHSEGGCRRDFEMVLDRGRILVFHDIVSAPVPGVGEVWREVKNGYADRFDFLEFVDQYPELKDQAHVDYLGIGMAVSRRGAR
jgi:cephalosporin hydroxylase